MTLHRLVAVFIIAATIVVVDAALPPAPSVPLSLAARAAAAQAAASAASVAAPATVGSGEPVYTWDTFTYEQTLDHFNFAAPKTFSQKYLVNLTHWRKPTAKGAGPIFLYAGNEGPIELFAKNTGFMWEIAPEYEAGLIFIEHRYYGDSKPFGSATFHDSNNLQWLTSEQALADFAELLVYLKKEVMMAVDTPVIVFGGSYGGMLAAWMRMKHPHLVAGAIASSAPIMQFTGLVNDNIFAQLVTRDYAAAGCSKQIRRSWDILLEMSTTQANRDILAEIFQLCQPLTNMDDIGTYLFNTINSAWQYMAMADYPYDTTFLGPMPGYPVTVACSRFSNSSEPLEILRSVKRGMDVYYNYTGTAGTCYNITASGPSTLEDDGGWDYQSCTEMVMPMGQDGISDMFWPAPWNLTYFASWCRKRFPAAAPVPRAEWVPTYFGGKNLQGYSNILFANGDLDPWMGGGVTWTTSNTPSLVVTTIAGGAHHLELRHSNPKDPQSVIDARNLNRQWITTWINAATHDDDTTSGGKLSRSALIAISAGVTAVVVGFTCFCFYRRSGHNGQLQSYQGMATA